jgi:hypothetical protein
MVSPTRSAEEEPTMSRLQLIALITLIAAQASAAPPVKLTLRYDEGNPDYTGKALRGKEVKVTASTTLCEKNGFCHRAERLIDSKNDTAWCEGAPGKGVGQKVVFELKTPRSLTAITFLPFYAKNKKTFFDNAQAKELEIKTDTGTYSVVFSIEDPAGAFAGGQLDHSHPYVNFLTDPKIKKAVSTKRVEITVKAVYAGARFEDLCMSALDLYAR